MSSAKIVAIEHLSLDGVYQAPGETDEDPRGGFRHGGWAAAHDAPETQAMIGKVMDGGWSLLAGRVTYQALHRGWRVRQPEAPMAKSLTGVDKFVVTRQADLALPWENSEALVGEAAQTVGALKARHDKTLVIFGSGALVRTLWTHRLLDELLLMIHPILLGPGLRLFDETLPFSELALVDELVAGSGLLAARYRRA